MIAPVKITSAAISFPLGIIAKLPTTNAADNHVRVTLHVTFRKGLSYPSEAPLLRVVSDKGLSSELTGQLQARLYAQSTLYHLAWP